MNDHKKHQSGVCACVTRNQVKSQRRRHNSYQDQNHRMNLLEEGLKDFVFELPSERRG